MEFILFLSLLLPWLLGYSVVQLLFQKNPPPLTLQFALSYGLGMGILSQWILCLGVAGIPYTENIIRLPLVLVMLLFLTIAWLRRSKYPHDPITIHDYKKAGIVEILLVSYVLFHIVVVLEKALQIPTCAWDAIATNGFIAKIIYFENSLRFFKNFPHNVYPLHVSFLQYWIALNLGTWHEQFINIIFPFYFVSLLVIQYHFISMFTNQRWALIGLAMLVSSPLLIYHATVPYRDFTIAYYLSTTMMLLILWQRFKNDAFLWLASAFAGVTTFVKLEGTVYLLFFIFICFYILRDRKDLSLKEKGKKFLKFFLPAFTICIFYHAYKFFALEGYRQFRPGSTVDFNFLTIGVGFGGESWARIPVIAEQFFATLFLMGNWSLIWLIFCVSLLNYKMYKTAVEVRVLLLALFLFFTTLIFAFLFTQHFKWIAEGKDLLSRSILQFFPLIPATIALTHGPRK